MFDVDNESRIAFALREAEEFMITCRCELDEDEYVESDELDPSVKEGDD